ncbi:MAG: MFS transporter [Clostridiales bacterium]|nr:MFS transporter [Clostridiales bacterium]
MKLLKKIRSIYLIDVFLNLKGNPRACIWLEPLWGIPYNLYVPYVALFQAALGMSPSDIGIVTSIFYASQAVASVLSGVVTDKLGRRKTTLIFDTLSWSVPTFLWMCATNKYWFMAAALFNGLWRITDNSWGLLLIEDADSDKIVHMYSLTSVMGLIAAFVAPMSALAVNRFGVTDTMRVLYGVTCLSMTAKFVILYFWSTETTVGVRRMALTKNKSIFVSLYECKDVFLRIIREKRMVLTLGIMAAFSLVNALSADYFGLYLKRELLIDESYMALFTMVKSIVRLVCMFLLARVINADRFLRPMTVAWSMFILGQATLLVNPGGALGIPLAFVQVVFEAVALSILYPMTSSILFINADKEERARINGLIFATIALVTAVFPALIGLLADVNLAVPFYAIIVVYVIAIVLTFQINRLPERKENV